MLYYVPTQHIDYDYLQHFKLCRIAVLNSFLIRWEETEKNILLVLRGLESINMYFLIFEEYYICQLILK